MNEEKIKGLVDEALNAEEFDVLDYVDNQEAAKDEVVINVNVSGAKRMHKLLQKRSEYLAEQRALARNGKEEPMGLDEAYEDTEYDDEVNALHEELQKTALTFELKSIAPPLVDAIEKHYKAVLEKDADEERIEAHNRDRMADILSRTILSVRRGDGMVDNRPWDMERLKALEDRIYSEEFAKLLGAMYDMVHTGAIFDEVLNADFS